MSQSNPIGLSGIDFVEFSTCVPQYMHLLFTDLGFCKVAKHKSRDICLYQQGDICFLLNSDKESFGSQFQRQHGPSISSMGWRVQNEERAYQQAIARGAKPADNVDYESAVGKKRRAVEGIGGSLIYFVEPHQNDFLFGFEPLANPVHVASKGFTLIDHLTNNVYKGTMQTWARFYKDIFGFQEVRYFDIRGKKTGLTSYALKSPCGSFCIPINEADEAKSQINEYLEEYQGPGIQHLALLTKDLIGSIEKLQGTSIRTLDIADDYYEYAFKRVPGLRQDKKRVQDLNILVDGDEDGYLLQIFTKNVVGPIFFEFIQRENHLSFGEGNFQALFESIERDQIKRGVL